MELLEDKDLYGLKPSEILPIEPVLIYPPSTKERGNEGRAFNGDNEIIYIKLLKRKTYRPQKLQNQIDKDTKYPSKELQMKDIFYVKALTNGQFSHNRLKVYRLPEFYAITVYKKGQLAEER